MAYLPKLESTNVYFLKAILNGSKEVIPNFYITLYSTSKEQMSKLLKHLIFLVWQLKTFYHMLSQKPASKIIFLMNNTVWTLIENGLLTSSIHLMKMDLHLWLKMQERRVRASLKRKMISCWPLDQSLQKLSRIPFHSAVINLFFIEIFRLKRKSSLYG